MNMNFNHHKNSSFIFVFFLKNLFQKLISQSIEVVSDATCSDEELLLRFDNTLKSNRNNQK